LERPSAPFQENSGNSFEIAQKVSGVHSAYRGSAYRKNGPGQEERCSKVVHDHVSKSPPLYDHAMISAAHSQGYGNFYPELCQNIPGSKGENVF